MGPAGEAGANDGTTETLIFVDVDGVINVAIKDPGHSALHLDLVNIRTAEQIHAGPDSPARELSEKILAARDFPLGHGDRGTFGRLAEEVGEVGPTTIDVPGTFASRLALLIEAAGPSGTVVLSSTWRMPKHAARRRTLESLMSNYLPEPFHFHDITAPRSERTPGDRLVCIGNYIEEYCRRQHAAGGPCPRTLRVLVLEDLFITPICGIAGGIRVDSAIVRSEQDVEAYLAGRVPRKRSYAKVLVRFVHTYDEFFTDKGSFVQMGAGLTARHYCRAAAFMGFGCECCSKRKGQDAATSPFWQGLVKDSAVETEAESSWVRPMRFRERKTSSSAKITDSEGCGTLGPDRPVLTCWRALFGARPQRCEASRSPKSPCKSPGAALARY